MALHKPCASAVSQLAAFYAAVAGFNCASLLTVSNNWTLRIQNDQNVAQSCTQFHWVYCFTLLTCLCVCVCWCCCNDLQPAATLPTSALSLCFTFCRISSNFIKKLGKYFCILFHKFSHYACECVYFLHQRDKITKFVLEITCQKRGKKRHSVCVENRKLNL